MIFHHKCLYARKPSTAAQAVHRLSSSIIAKPDGFRLSIAVPSARRGPIPRQSARKRPDQRFRSRPKSIDCRLAKGFYPTYALCTLRKQFAPLLGENQSISPFSPLNRHNLYCAGFNYLKSFAFCFRNLENPTVICVHRYG
jgi:hypothetical protein